ncbi:homeobox protein 13-like [Macrobrachium nipponense]|uniref:homeobox protein 13-like n=1 Tax=Macrobrachium nipponense TaxID=159736 RepID=UPI0030C873FE
MILRGGVQFGLVAVIFISCQSGALTYNERLGERMDDQKDLHFEESFRQLAYDLEVILQRHLRTWNFFTETNSVFDEGVTIDKNCLTAKLGGNVNISHVNGDVHLHNEKSGVISKDETSNYDDLQNPHSKRWKCSKVRVQQHNNTEHKSANERFFPKKDVAERKQVSIDEEERLLDDQREGKRKGKRSIWSVERRNPWQRTKRSTTGIPVMYMPGQKKKRQCVAAGGIFSGYNALSYLSFMTGILSLVLNVNNNINNNNNNNNLNDNNAVSNNNVDANSNSQTANQIVVFPPGRRRRSFADLWLTSSAASERLEEVVTNGGKRSVGSVGYDLLADGMITGLKLMAASALEEVNASVRRNG